MIADPEKPPCASDGTAPSVRSAGAIPGELSGPCSRIVTDSPGLHPLPLTVMALFQVNSSGCATPLAVMPPDTVTVAAKTLRGKRIARNIRYNFIQGRL